MAVATKITGAQAAYDTDAEFRTDTLAIHNALKAAGGLVQTADTGQTDFTANTRAAGGYTVYRFNDPDQASYPLYLRIDWTPAATSRPGFSFTLGTGSNGAGTITGVMRSSYQISGGGAGLAAGLCDNYISIGDGYLYVVLGIIAGSPGNQVSCMLSIERPTDESGVVHGDEGVVVFATGANAKSYSVHPQGGVTLGPATGSPISSALPWSFWDDQAGADTAIMPAPYMIKGKVRFHRMAFLRSGRVSYGIAFDATILGATRKMISIDQNYYNNSDPNGWLSSSVAGPAIAYPWV
jgi:hypothetical protein